MTDYTELKRLAEAATPTPWERGDGNEVMVSEEGDEAYWSWEQAGPAQIHGSGEQPVRDADFIAAANPAAVLALIADPQWQPYIVFPGEFVAPQRVVSEVRLEPGKRPLFILLDATWSEARKMFRKSPYLEYLPVLSLQPEQLSRYKLRRSKRDDHFCTAEVAALCLELADDQAASEVLDAYLDVFSTHYLSAKFQQAIDPDDDVHTRLKPYL